jgi:hypothetical protein
MQSKWERRIPRTGYLLEGKKPLGRSRRRCLDNIKTDLVEIGWSELDWMGLAQDKDKWKPALNAVMSPQVP